MARTLNYVWTIAFVAGVLIGIQLPGFVDQYGKALVAHHQEAAANLSEFQDDADRYFDGDLDDLIAYYRRSPDEVFSEGGRSIAAVAERVRMLEAAVRRFRAGALSPYIQTLLFPVPEIRREVAGDYTYTIVLDGSAILVGLLAGVLAALVFDGCCGAVKYPVSRIRKRRARKLDHTSG